jgi:hypothetical protein
MIASMEGKMQQLANQLSDQINLYKEIEAKYHHGEARVVELEHRLKNLDGEYCANEVLRDNLKSDRVKVCSIFKKKKKKTANFINHSSILPSWKKWDMCLKLIKYPQMLAST